MSYEDEKRERRERALRYMESQLQLERGEALWSCFEKLVVHVYELEQRIQTLEEVIQ